MSKQKPASEDLELRKQTLKDLPVDGSDVQGGGGPMALRPGTDRMTIGTSGPSVIAPGTQVQTGGTSVIAPGGH
jgi:hypothetical protein